MLFATLDLSLPVDHSRQACGIDMRREQLWMGVNFIFSAKIFVLRIDILLNKKYLFQIKWSKVISKYKTMHILLTNVHLDCRGEGSSNGNASRDESVETGDESVETGDESVEAGEKHNNHVMIFNSSTHFYRPMWYNFRIRMNVYVPVTSSTKSLETAYIVKG